jgi:hypothetical protein
LTRRRTTRFASHGYPTRVRCHAIGEWHGPRGMTHMVMRHVWHQRCHTPPRHGRMIGPNMVGRERRDVGWRGSACVRGLARKAGRRTTATTGAPCRAWGVRGWVVCD